MAAWHGHREAVQLLINHGADVSAVNKVSILMKFFSGVIFGMRPMLRATLCVL